MSEQFEIKAWAARVQSLFERAKKILSSAVNEKVRLISEKIPQKPWDEKSTIKLVFAGQYSAGKSTILKVLTGRADIAVGGGITTEESSSYDWNGIKVIDTPGVHTELRADHDEITYRAIADADLLLFVVTNELFDSHLAQHFRRLAIEKDKAHEMMLVVNKMQRCSQGNSRDVQNIIREDIKKILTPFNPEDLYISFIDAESALEAQEEKDKRMAKLLRQHAAIDSFIENLNRFVRKKGLSSKYTTPLYTLIDLLQEALVVEPTEDKDADGFKELQMRKKKILTEGRRQISDSVKAEIQKACSIIKTAGQQVAHIIDGTVEQEAVNQKFQQAQEQVDSVSAELGKIIENKINDQIANIGKRVEGIATSILGKELLPRLERRAKETSHTNSSKLKKASEFASSFSQFLVQSSTKAGVAGSIFKLSRYSGTATHNAVKGIGNFLGMKFKPWGAIKLTRGFANFGRVLGVAGAAATIFLQIKEDRDEEKRASELHESRNDVRIYFNDAAHAVENHYEKVIHIAVDDLLTPEIEEIDKQLSELYEMQKKKTKLSKNILALQEESQKLIEDLHAANAHKNVQEIDA